MSIQLSTPILTLSPIATKVDRQLKKLNLETVRDLIFYYPTRHDDLSKIFAIADLVGGEIATIKGKIELLDVKRSPYRRQFITEALVSDATGAIKIIWYNQPYLKNVLAIGDVVYLSGKVELDKFGLEMRAPVYEKVPKIKSFQATHTARIVPVYALTSRLTQKQIRYLIKLALAAVWQIKDFLPAQVKRELEFFSLAEALRQIHFPTSPANLKRAQVRLKFDELFLMQLEGRILKQELAQYQAPKIKFWAQETREFVKKLPFKLTEAQRQSSWEILQDLEHGHPMNRLLEGDVGSGKTIVAVLAILNTILNQAQVAYMAPTEVLAQQHFTTIIKWLKLARTVEALGVQSRENEKKERRNKDRLVEGKKNNRPRFKIALLTKSYQFISHGTKNPPRKIKNSELLKKISHGQVDLVVGTHALIQEKISFKNLALAIIDEQHRFGVKQRKKLHDLMKKQAGFMPHLLSMTATPIPRTLALALYGDLDLSVIDEMPAGRKQIKTKIVKPVEREQTYQFMRDEIKEGRQVFVICPLIDHSDKLGVKSVTVEYQKLNEKIFPDLEIGFLHGRLRPEEKEKVMRDFVGGKISILVATSVIEVGIDVPRASVMMIEGAERFGLAQLHQFRGRVGRAELQSYCFLFTESLSSISHKRLEALKSSSNGFELAKKDLELRGPGELYGLAQSGFPKLKIATLGDYALMKQAEIQVLKVMPEDSDLVKFPELKTKLEEFIKTVHLE